MALDGKVALITGSSRGIGRASALALAARGARVAVHFRDNEDAAARTLADLAGDGHCAVKADVSDPHEVQRLVEEVTGRCGGLDVLVNNAGIGGHHALEEVDYEEWRSAWQRILATNLLGPANLSWCAARFMMTRGGGRIVNVSSRGAFRGEPRQPAYGASKAGLNALGQSLAQALAPHGVLVFTVAPGFVETDLAAARLAGSGGDELRAQSPFKRVARPEEVAAVVAYLAAEAPEFMSGCIVDVNGASYLRS
ncbi:MAG: SDR family oxidoreductase [Gammaproteobacteria bacterium]|nr:SDR family oxidoreductase [Gammaproteobacteria bacterium]